MNRPAASASVALVVAAWALGCEGLLGIRDVVGGATPADASVVDAPVVVDATAVEDSPPVVDAGPMGCEYAQQPVTIARTAIASTLALDEENVFWSTAVPNKYRILRCPLCGCPPEGPIELANGLVASLAVDDRYVFWTDFGGGSINRFDKLTGKNQDRISGEVNPTGVAVDQDKVYWTAIGDVTPDAGDIYGNGVRRADKRTLHTVEDMVPAGPLGAFAPYAIAVDATHVYWTTAPQLNNISIKDPATNCNTMSSVKGQINRVDKITLKVEQLARGQNCPLSIALDEDNVYWTTVESGIDGKIRMTTKAKGGPVIDLAIDQPSPFGIAVGGGRAYWVTSLTVGTVSSCFIASCTPAPMATGERSPLALALSADHVYWANQGTQEYSFADSTIRRILR